MSAISDHEICRNVRDGVFPIERHAAWWGAFERCEKRGLVATSGIRLTEKGWALIEGTEVPSS